MEYIIKPKITHYKGIRFRSKLEAQWAAFFDLVNIPYEYEPEKFDRWEPDFLIGNNMNVYVEVKPFIDEDIIKDYQEKCKSIINNVEVIDKKIVEDDWFGEYESVTQDVKTRAIILTKGDADNYEQMIGVQFLYYNSEVFIHELNWKQNWDIGSINGDWTGLLGIEHDNKVFITDRDLIKRKWNEAKNIIQTKINYNGRR